MARRLKSAPEPTARQVPDLRVSVAEAINGMTWLSPSDAAIKALAMRYADEIEQVTERADLLRDLQSEVGGDPGLFKRLQKLEAMCDVTKTVGWLGQQLQGVLRDLGGTPAARKAMAESKPIGGRLAQLRAEAES
jgi:hypothetical protein